MSKKWRGRQGALGGSGRGSGHWGRWWGVYARGIWPELLSGVARRPAALAAAAPDSEGQKVPTQGSPVTSWTAWLCDTPARQQKSSGAVWVDTKHYRARSASALRRQPWRSGDRQKLSDLEPLRQFCAGRIHQVSAWLDRQRVPTARRHFPPDPRRSVRFSAMLLMFEVAATLLT
jgi:hypothetical protein